MDPAADTPSDIASAASTADDRRGSTDPEPDDPTTSERPDTSSTGDEGGRHAKRTIDDRAERVFPEPAGRLALQTFGVAVGAWLLIAYLYELWDAVLRRPVANRYGDMNQIEMMVKNITETGWFLHGPRIGAPWGQQYYDVPHGGETLQLFFIKLITIFVQTTGLTVNIYYLTGFGVVAAVTFLVLRHLRFGPVISAVCAIGFTFLPYHFTHGEAHLYRSSYYWIPLIGLIILWNQSWRTRYLVDPADGGASWRDNIRWKRVLAALVLCVVIGSSETMSTFFAVLLLGSLGVVSAIRWREWQRLLVALVPIVVIGATFFICSFPSFWFWHQHGTNEVAGRRAVMEGERYGLKLTNLLLPTDGSRLEALDDYADRVNEDTAVGLEGGQSLGLLGAAAFVALMYGVIAGPRQPRGPNGDPRAPDDRGALREHAGLATVMAFLFGTVAGLGLISSVVGFSQIRTWGRVSIIIAFFVMLQVAMWGEQISAWAHRRERAATKPLLGALAIVLLVATIALNPPIRVYHPELQVRRWEADRAFVGKIESVLPEGSAVLQLPIIPFPEADLPYDMHDYDHFRAYLADNGRLTWSYGAVKGRPDADWQTVLREEVGPVAGLHAILGMGFTGLWIDKDGYGPTRDDRYEILMLRRILGPATEEHANGRFEFYDLRPYREKLPQTDDELREIAQQQLGVTPPPAPRPLDESAAVDRSE